MTNDLQSKWRDFWNGLNAGGMVGKYEELRRHYSEPHRHYHNLIHIEECFQELASIPFVIPEKDKIEAAIWFHDVIYDPQAKDNEERSAELARQWMRSCSVSEAFAQAVGDLIMATKFHLPKNESEKIMVDVDLSILGRGASRFNLYERQIRQEYAWVSDQAFGEGRSAVLRTFLDRPFIYATVFFRQKYEQAARANLAHSLNNLSRDATNSYELR